MLGLPGRLGTLHASHVMTSDVLSLRTTETLADALHKLQERHISGAPVINEAGELVGILSFSDIVEYEVPESKLKSPAIGSYPDWPSLWKMIEAAEQGPQIDLNDTVEKHMTRNVKSVSKSTNLVEMARMMC
ncbi:MAG: CBS domain-containing protein, partial [Planctomycetaceae bacterium]|nr:CBS domain-containing protein [Planctomycetaceae bacterium]